MEKTKIGFKGERYNETSLEDYVNKWVLVKFRNGHSMYGYLKDINKKEFNLFPYPKMNYKKGGNPKYEIEGKGLPDTYERIDVIGYRQSSKDEAINFCESMNKKLYLENLRETKEIIDIENIISRYKNQKKPTIN
jgi:hypothetical protein